MQQPPLLEAPGHSRSTQEEVERRKVGAARQQGRPALEEMCYGIKEEDKDMQQGFITPLSRALGTLDQLFNLSTPRAP